MIAILAVLVLVAAVVLIAAIVAGIVLTTRSGRVAESTGELEGEDGPDYGDEPPERAPQSDRNGGPRPETPSVQRYGSTA